jgi:hypothetical protein
MRFVENGFSKEPGQGAEERIRWNQLALFGLWLRGFQSGCLVVVTRQKANREVRGLSLSGSKDLRHSG